MLFSSGHGDVARECVLNGNGRIGGVRGMLLEIDSRTVMRGKKINC
jgi:hypothetical protein